LTKNAYPPDGSATGVVCRSNLPLDVALLSNSMTRALVLEISVASRVSVPFTPTFGSEVMRVTWRFPSAAVVTEPPVIESVTGMTLKLMKSCSPPVIAPPLTTNAPATK
jgi:hypothetical protein